MKKKIITRTLCVTMALLVFCLPMNISAKETSAEIPLIRMTGGQAPLTDIENPNISYSSSYDLSPETLTDILEKIKQPLLAAVKNCDWAEAGRVAGAFLWKVFGDLQMYPDGTSKNYAYRQETTPVPGYDDKAYASPKRDFYGETEMDAYAAIFDSETSNISVSAEPEAPKSSPSPNFGASFLKAASSAFGGALCEIYKSVMEFIESNGLQPVQPEPEQSWQNVDAADFDVYKFAFDWRQSPIDVADQLHDYVLAVKAYTGAEKVYIQSLSASGSVALAYIDKYVNDVENFDTAGIFISIPLANGMGIIGSGYQKKLLPDARALAYSSSLPFVGELDENTHALLAVLHTTGILDLLCSMMEFLPIDFIDSMYSSALIPLYGTFPGMWALVPPEMYDDAKAACFGSQKQIDEMGYRDFFLKTDAYHSLQINCRDILQRAASRESFKIAVITGYGISAWPLSINQGRQSDSGVETVYASFGARVSKIGETLGTHYKQDISSCGHNHLSPDKQIDASCAALPEYTWFVKAAIHGEQNEWNGFFSWWYSTENPSVNSNERWPQFLYAYGNVSMGSQDAVYPLRESAYTACGKIAAKISTGWNIILTAWSRKAFVATKYLSCAWDIFSTLMNN